MNSLIADNQISVKVTLTTPINIHMKTTMIDSKSIRQDIYLKNNHSDLTIALTDNSYGTTFIDYTPLTTSPISFSNRIHYKFTKIGELTISKKENKNSLGVTICVN